MFRSFLLAASLFVCSTSALASGNPVDIHGRLQASGNRIVGAKSGDTVQLTGMSLFWNQWPEGGPFYNAKTINWLVDDFRCSVVRATIGVDDLGNMASDTAHTYPALRAVVDAATARGVYVIIDWHSHYAIRKPQAAKDFFETFSAQYGQNPAVIFEVFNEPWDDVYTWQQIKAYHEMVIPVIRNHSDNLILAGTRKWSRDVDSAALNPLVDPNLAYVLHFYSGSHRDSLRDQGRTALALGKALFVSEWGTTESTGGGTDKTVYAAETDKWFAWMDSNKISSCNWSIQNKNEASAALKAGVTKLSGWDSADLSESGKYARARSIERNTQYSFDLPPVDSNKLPGRIEAEDFTTKGDLDVSGPGDDNSPFLGFSKTTSWAEYQTSIPQSRKGVIALRLGSGEANAQVTVKVNGRIATVVKFTGTGGWGTWKTVVSDSFLVSQGPTKVRLEWNGLFDLNWFELSGRKDETPVPPVYDTIHQSVRIEAENFIRKNGMTAEASGDDNTGSLGYTNDSSWAEYKALLPKGRQAVAVRVASDNGKGSILKVKVNGNLVATLKVAATGGWQSWKTVVSDSFNLSGTDSALVRVEWSDTAHASSLVNLNWLEFRGPDILASAVAARPVVKGMRATFQGAGLAIDFGKNFSGTVQVMDLRGRILAQAQVSGLASTVLAVPAWKGLAVIRLDGTQTTSLTVMHP